MTVRAENNNIAAEQLTAATSMHEESLALRRDHQILYDQTQAKSASEISALTKSAEQISMELRRSHVLCKDKAILVRAVRK